MNRAFLFALAALWLFHGGTVSWAQQPKRIPVVGMFAHVARNADDPLYAAFREGLRDLGYVEGRNIAFEFRTTAGRAERLAKIADEFVRLKVDVIFTLTAVNASAAKRASPDIPIVFALGNDPISVGLVSSLSHPGGNITGLSFMHLELNAKVLQLLKETIPHLNKAAVLWNPDTPRTSSQEKFYRDIGSAASQLSIDLVFIPAHTPEELETAFASASRARVQALYMSDSPLFYVERETVVRLAARSRMPVIYRSRIFAEAGGMISYGVDWLDQSRRAAGYVDKILKGAKAGDLPIEQPTNFELIVNLKTAKAVGVTIPEPILLRADEVIR